VQACYSCSLDSSSGSHAVFIKYVFDVALVPKTPRLILTVALVVFGFQMIMFGFLAEMIIKIHYRHEDIYRVEERYGYE
jgi:hypothetical protein